MRRQHPQAQIPESDSEDAAVGRAIIVVLLIELVLLVVAALGMIGQARGAPFGHGPRQSRDRFCIIAAPRLTVGEPPGRLPLPLRQEASRLPHIRFAPRPIDRRSQPVNVDPLRIVSACPRSCDYTLKQPIFMRDGVSTGRAS